MHETAINNHNGIISNESRLIYVIDRTSKAPIYYKSVSGNIVDVTTLNSIINELKSYNINIDYSVLDAGYYSEANIKYLYSNHVHFVTRMISNRIAYKELLNDEINDLVNMKNSFIYKSRLIYGIKKPFKLFGYNAYAYICIDHKIMCDETFTLANNTNKIKKLTPEQLENERKLLGLFILISSIDLSMDEILPYYYERQSIEQLFDVLKNEVNVIPIRCHNHKTYLGHIFVSFLSTITYLFVNNMFKSDKLNARSVFSNLKYLLCKQINGNIHVDNVDKTMRNIFTISKLSIPTIISSNKLL
jgi:transposase